jgi:hypothetical protein
MVLSESQRRLLDSADSDGRVFISRLTAEVAQLIREGYLEENIYQSGCYWVRKRPLTFEDALARRLDAERRADPWDMYH